MTPNLIFNYQVIAVAVVASFVFGFIWHGPIFGKLWLRLMGWEGMTPPSKSKMITSMFLTLVGTFLTAYAIACIGQLGRPSVWGVGQDDSYCHYAFKTGFFIWLGFYVPMLLSSVAWEKKSWGMFFLNGAYHFLNLQIIAMILAYWR